MAELIALATAETNACSYCLSAHSFFGAKAGLSDEQMSRRQKISFAGRKNKCRFIICKKILENPGNISSADIEPLRNTGYPDGDILEIVANVIRNIFTNYINTTFETEVDWPVIVKPLNTQHK